MKTEKEISDMIRKMTGLIDRDDVRAEVGNELAGLVLISDPEEFKELLSRYIRFQDGVDILKDKWRIVYNNSKMPLDLVGILAQDDNIRLDMLGSMKFLIDYGDFIDTSDLALALSKIEGGTLAISENFEELFEASIGNTENIVIPMLQNEIGRKKFKEHFEDIKTKFLQAANVKGFFETIKALEGIEGFEDIYEDFGFWAEIYDQIQIPEVRRFNVNKPFNLSSREAEKFFNDSMAESIKQQEFLRILNSEDREEKRLVLEKVANGNPYKYKACGTSSFVIQAGDQIVKFETLKDKFEIPYHPRIMMPWFRKKYSDDTALEVYNFGNAESAEITDQVLLDIYKELEEAGILWGDARKSNLLVLTKDNDLPDFIASKDFNLFGFLEDERFPTNNHKALKAGDIVICDLYMLYAKGDPEYKVGMLDDVIKRYLHSQKVKKAQDGVEH